MDSWHKKHVDVLSEAIVNEFSYLFEKINNKKDSIYAAALILDDDILTAYLAVSTKESLDNKHKGYKWDPSEWIITVDDNIISNDLNSFIRLMIKHYDEEIVPLYQNGFNYEAEKLNNLWLYTSALMKAKNILITTFGETINSIVFYLSIPGQPEIEINSAKEINDQSNELTELIKYRS
ncbi:DUF4303 domain-containing protein [Acinetobacter gerneri]|uniref:DUF4303 domain-containing protein n=1 Tax=Acinetobacter gerneri TaxID=202952 RepID=A0AAW8JNL2_9GAMM|nr:DUF4303 domain-containing protein [Acinetobacter gerneri]MDQ9011141.1 DUF4303 domain-containing protein [Acinetobacter gerneri]MDQ9015277.1 DUF4303 domain-containing protein [Acinetobacter gerneri]MDQ9026448.1 DUF4303 domain-containing protein [Acinetobacter gerneri]MDQ9053729.1 DUF4303 domain-containing protein [Acinetobacter gerneri]MDQ9061330.1 DUF4303 domain-containing protein [Acinetobacter gerneri]